MVREPVEKDGPECVICGGILSISATMIGCQSCGAVWGRCNGLWIEDMTARVDPSRCTVARGDAVEAMRARKVVKA